MTAFHPCVSYIATQNKCLGIVGRKSKGIRGKHAVNRRTRSPSKQDLPFGRVLPFFQDFSRQYDNIPVPDVYITTHYKTARRWIKKQGAEENMLVKRDLGLAR